MFKVKINNSNNKIEKPKQLKHFDCSNLTNLVSLKGNVNFLKLLFDKGYSKVDSRDFNGNTPLHNAAFSGNNNCVNFLLEKGANKLVKNNLGLTPGMLAARKGHLNLAYFLHPGYKSFFSEQISPVVREDIDSKHYFKNKLK